MQKRKNKSKVGDEASQRQLRVSELIKRNISKILLDSNFYDQNGKKKKLPEGWIRKAGEEYNGLYYYSYKGEVPQWKHP